MVGEIWDLIILQPIINSLVVLSSVLFSNFGVTIIVLTIIIRGVMLPLTLKQLRATKGMQVLQPQLAELQKKYGKDKQRLAQEQLKMYKESGLNPAGCLLPMLIQLPVWIALYQSIIRVLATTPEGFLNLSQYLYSWPLVHSMLPLGNQFLWLNLAEPDGFLLLPILVGGTMWVQQKMIVPVTSDPRQQAQSKMMLWMMPLMFAFLTLSFPSGLALYWVTSNVISIVMQYYVTGWGALAPARAGEPMGRDKKLKTRIALEATPTDEAPIDADIVEPASLPEGGLDRGGDYPSRLKEIRRQPGRSRSSRHKRK